MSRAGRWTQESFSDRLREIAATSPLFAPPAKQADLEGEGFRRSAAVLSTFNPTELQPYGQEARSPGDFTAVLDDSYRVAGGRGGAWTLRPEVRARTLRRLLDEGTLGDVVSGTEAPEDDPLNRILRGIVSGELQDFEVLSETELTAALELAKGVGKKLPGLPPPQELSRLLGRKRLLGPFHHLANPEHFRGRDDELEKLRNYVGVTDPRTTTGSIFRHVREFLGFEKRPPLMIFGPGGMGKSALLSHFILEHAELDDERRFPFAYLDFDRPSVTAREPLTVLGEVLIQLGIQYPVIADECEKARGELLPHLGWAFQEPDPQAEVERTILETVLVNRSTSSSRFERQRFIQILAGLFGQVASMNQPLLLVLDTFEEIQHYSRTDIPDLISFLEQVQAAIPRLRVVLAGRTRETSVRIEPLPLDPLALDDAAAVLASYGVTAKTAKVIAGKLGGNPLTLRLAIEVYQRDGLDTSDLTDITGRQSFFRKVDDQRVQGELYRRFLNHIKDEEVRRLAHPGLVLRRVTPDLILKVLRQPCGLEIETPDQARRLFEKLGVEDTLVSWEGSAIVHRSDVRRVMIELLAEDQGDQVRAIHENAVDHYQAFEDVVSRAEEIYHRYCLDQESGTIDSRWIPGIEDRLRPAVNEIPERLRPHLASRTGAETLDAGEWEKADDRDWERYIAGQASQLIGHARYEEALELMSHRSWKTWSGASPLFNLEVVALTQLGELERAFVAGQDALRRIRTSGGLEQEMDLLASLGSVARRTGRPDDAVQFLEQAAGIAEQRGELVRAADLLVLALETGEWRSPSETTDSKARESLARLVEKVEPQSIVAAPVLFSRAAEEIDSSHPEPASRLRKVLDGGDQTRKGPAVGKSRNWTTGRTRQLHDSVFGLISEKEELDKILHVHLDLPLRQVTKGGDLRSTIFELIVHLQRVGRLDEFLTALREEFPDARSLREPEESSGGSKRTLTS